MKLHPVSVLVLAVTFLAAAPAGAAPDRHADPNEIASHCIHAVRAKAANRVHHNQALSVECVDAIEELLDAGHPGAAHHVAQRCVHRIMTRSHFTLARIKAQCTHCVEVLIFLERPDLAGAVAEACQEAAGAVNASRHAAISSIRDALGDGEALGALDTCPADIDGDGTVGVNDLAALAGAYGTDGDGGLDLDADGIVGAGDFTELLLGWGVCP